jgi:hypothetical protein
MGGEPMDNTIKVLNTKALERIQCNDVLPCECDVCDECSSDSPMCGSDQPMLVWKLSV